MIGYVVMIGVMIGYVVMITCEVLPPWQDLCQTGTSRSLSWSSQSSSCYCSWSTQGWIKILLQLIKTRMDQTKVKNIWSAAAPALTFPPPIRGDDKVTIVGTAHHLSSPLLPWAGNPSSFPLHLSPCPAWQGSSAFLTIYLSQTTRAPLTKVGPVWQYAGER